MQGQQVHREAVTELIDMLTSNNHQAADSALYFQAGL